MACPLAAFLDFTQLDESGGEVGQCGTAMFLQRRVEGVKCPGEGRNGISWSAKLQVTDTVIGLKLGMVERANPDPGSLVVLVRFVECMAGLFECSQRGRRVTCDCMDLGRHGGKPALSHRACHSFGGVAGLFDQVTGLLAFAAIAGMEAHAAEDERSEFACLSLLGRCHRQVKVAAAELEVVQVHEPQGPGQHGRFPGYRNEALAQLQGLLPLQQLGDGLELALCLRKQGVDGELPI